MSAAWQGMRRRVLDDARAEHDREIAHAVALERAAIIAYLEAGCPDGDGCFHDFIHAIRAGAHNPQTPTSGSGTALSRDRSADGDTDGAGEDSGQETAENDTRESK